MKRTLNLVLTGITASVLAIAPANSQSADPVVLMETTKGPIAIRVFRRFTPNTANNFLDLVSRGYYNGKTFHRVEGWLIQGGCPYGNGRGNFVDPATGQVRYVPLEVSPRLGHGQPGMVAMARSANPDSASCQFYILKQAKPSLNGQYAVFGMVVGGLNTVYSIGIGDRIISAHVDEPVQRNANSSSESRPQDNNGDKSSGSSSGGNASTSDTSSGF